MQAEVQAFVDGLQLDVNGLANINCANNCAASNGENAAMMYATCKYVTQLRTSGCMDDCASLAAADLTKMNKLLGTCGAGKQPEGSRLGEYTHVTTRESSEPQPPSNHTKLDASYGEALGSAALLECRALAGASPAMPHLLLHAAEQRPCGCCVVLVGLAQMLSLLRRAPPLSRRRSWWWPRSPRC
jgi:hypothetical protein